MTWTPWPRPPNNRWKLYGHPNYAIVVQRVQPIQQSLVGAPFNFLVDDVLESLEEWSKSGTAGISPEAVEHTGVREGTYKFGKTREHTAQILAAWLPVPGNRAVPQNVAGAAIHQMRVLIAEHSVAQLVRLELLLEGVPAALVKLGIVTDEHDRVEETAQAA